MNEAINSFNQNVQKTLYVKHPQPSSESHNLGFTTLLNNQEPIENTEERYLLFTKFWNDFESKYEQILRDHHLPVIQQIIGSLETQIETQDLDYFGIPQKVPVTLLLSGTNISVHNEIFLSLESHIKQNKNLGIKLVLIDSCNDVRNFLKQINYQLFTYKEILKLKIDSFEMINHFYKTNNFAKIVIVIKNINFFNQNILLKFLKILQNYPNLPIRLIFNIPSFNTDYLKHYLSNSLKTLIDCQIIKLENSTGDLIDKIFLNLLNTKINGVNLLIGRKLAHTLLEIQNENVNVTNDFLKSLKVSILKHFYSIPGVIFIENSTKKIDLLNEPENKTDLPVVYLNYLRNLPSFQKLVETLIKNENKFSDNQEDFDKILNYLININEEIPETKCLDWFVLELIPFVLKCYNKTTNNMINFIKLVDIIQNSIVNNNDFLIKKSIINSNTTTNTLKFIKKSKFQIYYNLLYNGRNTNYRFFIKEILAAIKSLIPYYFCELIDNLIIFCENVNWMDNFYQKLKEIDTTQFKFNGEFFNDISKEESYDGLKNLKLLGKIQFEKIIESLIDCLKYDLFHDIDDDFRIVNYENSNEIVKKILDIGFSFQKIGTIPFTEILILENDIIENLMNPNYRKILENSLLNSKEYFKEIILNEEEMKKVKQLKRKSNEKDNIKHKKNKSSVNQNYEISIDDLNNEDLINYNLRELRKLNHPLIIEMFKLYREAPVNINLFDYFDSFKSLLNKPKYLNHFWKIINNFKSDEIFINDEFEISKPINTEFNIASPISEELEIIDDEFENFESKNYIDNIFDDFYKIILPFNQLKSINPNDEEFKNLTNKINNNWEKVVFYWFLEFFADLKYLGLFKKNRGFESIEKGIWKFS